jgi:hypothetical protein
MGHLRKVTAQKLSKTGKVNGRGSASHGSLGNDGMKIGQDMILRRSVSISRLIFRGLPLDYFR